MQKTDFQSVKAPLGMICTPNTGHPVLGVLPYEIQLWVQADVH